MLNLKWVQPEAKPLPDTLLLALDDNSMWPGAPPQPEAKPLPDALLLALSVELSERERQYLNKGTRHFRKRFIFSHQKLCLFWYGAETRVTKVRRFNLNIYVSPQKVHAFNEESSWTITSFITSHIYRSLTFISHFSHKSNTQTLWNHSSSSSHLSLHLLHFCAFHRIHSKKSNT